jgi:hypothetical protein
MREAVVIMLGSLEMFVSLAAGLFMASTAPATVAVDMNAGWIRRDWQKCQDPTKIAFENGEISFRSDRAKAQIWQVPLRSGPAAVDHELAWIRECDRPPISQARSNAKTISRDPDAINLAEYRWVSWRWRVNSTIDDTGLLDKNGRIKGANDFAAKLGFIFSDAEDGGGHEIAYVWTRHLPEESLFYQETVVIPIIFKIKLYRIVSESGHANLGRWIHEVRDLQADYERIERKGRAGALLRVYLMTDSDNTQGQVESAFAGITFHKQPPVLPTAIETARGSY